MRRSALLGKRCVPRAAAAAARASRPGSTKERSGRQLAVQRVDLVLETLDLSIADTQPLAFRLAVTALRHVEIGSEVERSF